MTITADPVNVSVADDALDAERKRDFGGSLFRIGKACHLDRAVVRSVDISGFLAAAFRSEPPYRSSSGSDFQRCTVRAHSNG